MIYIGIDPGINGAVAIIYEDGSITIYDAPRVGKEPDYTSYAAIIRDVSSQGSGAIACLEKVHAMPIRDPITHEARQGATSLFSFGRNYGVWLGILATLSIPVRHVAPQTWKASVLKDTKRDKEAAIQTARALWPHLAKVLLKSKDGRAEALLMAEYLRRGN